MIKNSIFLCICLFLVSCTGNVVVEDTKTVKPGEYDENLENANKMMTFSEDEQIDDYIARHSWDMQKTGTGLRYWIYSKGDGPMAKEMTIVRFNFKVELINGFVCYDSKTDGYQEIQLGHSNAPGGLEEGLALMSQGDKAKLILPSHLAYGLLGDQDKIPTRAILIYDVEILEVREM